MHYLTLVLLAFPWVPLFAGSDTLPPAPYQVLRKVVRPDRDDVGAILILVDSSGKKTELANCLVHDRKAPYYHWLNDSLLLYEYCNNNNYERIRVMNVFRKTVVLEKRGYMQLYGADKPPQNLDTLNRKLVYFTPNDQFDRFTVKVLDLGSLKTTTLITLATSGDSFGVPSCKKINPATRKVTVEYESPGRQGYKTVIVKY